MTHPNLHPHLIIRDCPRAMTWYEEALGAREVVRYTAPDGVIARAVGRRMEELGAKVIFPIEDQFYGDRQGRLQDPFGHLWVITQRLQALSPEEIQRRVTNYQP
jgi:PhnB protein